jgi:poly(A) polymerase
MKTDHLPTIAALARLQGAEVMLVGGAVRDQLLSLTPTDLDFAVHGNVIRLARAFADAIDGAFYVMDAERGVARVIARAADQTGAVFDFVLRRGDSWNDDLRERDFTINAIARSLDDGALIDPLQGADDLAKRVLRAVSPTALLDDPVRALRGVRLAHQFGLAIESTTRVQMAQAAAVLHVPSPERLRDALFAVLMLPAATAAVRELDALGLLAVWFSPRSADFDARLATLAELDADAAHTRALLPDDLSTRLSDHLRVSLSDNRSRLALLRLALLVHAEPVQRAEMPKASSQHETFRLSTAELALIRDIAAARRETLSTLHLTAPLTKQQIHSVMRAAGTAAPESVCAALAEWRFHDSKRTAPAEHVAVLLRAYFERYAPDVAPPPLLTGRDVLKLGLRPGRNVGIVLAALRDAQMTETIATRDAALQFVQTRIAALGSTFAAL